MKKILAILLLSVFVTSYTMGQDEPKKVEKKKETVVFDVSMTCEKCKKRIEKNIAYEKGVSDLKVDLPTKTVSVEYRTDKTSPEILQKAFEKLGYEASPVADNTKKEEVIDINKNK